MKTATATVMRPLHDRVWIRPLNAETVTPGGIVIPDVAKKKPQCGIVESVGPGALLEDGKIGRAHV